MKYAQYVFFVAFVVFLIYHSSRTEQNNKANELARGYGGIITGIRYDPKTIPYVTIGNEEYYLGNYPIRKHSNIQIGDSLIKWSNSNALKHYKKYPNGFYL